MSFTLLHHFRTVGEHLGAENDVTISRVLPVFEFLKGKLELKHSEHPIVRLMILVMLEKLNNWYNEKQTNFLKSCSLLDPQYKQSFDEEEPYANLVTHVHYICDKIK